MRGEAFCPAHITGFFKAELENSQSKYLGSLGAGFSIRKGVKTTVNVFPKKGNKKNYELIINGYKPDNTLVSEFVIKKFLELVKSDVFLEIHHDIGIPVGYGLGCSGAVALSLAFSLNEALGTNLSRIEVGQIAHDAEIFCKTGLGDVLASYHGGFEIRVKGGAPGIGELEKISVPETSVIVICFAPISTKEFLKEKLPFINGLGKKMVTKLVQSRDLEHFQDMSLEFAEYVKVTTPSMKTLIKKIQDRGFKCGVAMFGETVFTILPKEKESEIIEILSEYQDVIIIKSTIDTFGARLIQ